MTRQKKESCAEIGNYRGVLGSSKGGQPKGLVRAVASFATTAQDTSYHEAETCAKSAQVRKGSKIS
jgi:hypothetical protein